MSEDSNPQSGPLPRLPNKAERKAAKRAKQQEQANALPTQGELNSSRIARAAEEAGQRSAKIRLAHLEAGLSPMEQLTSNDFDGQQVYLSKTGDDEVKAHITDLVDHNRVTRGTAMVGPGLDPLFIAYISRRHFSRLRARGVLSYGQVTLVHRVWLRAEQGERLANVLLLRWQQKSVLAIAQELGVSTRTVDREIERLPAYLQALVAEG